MTNNLGAINYIWLVEDMKWRFWCKYAKSRLDEKQLDAWHDIDDA